MTRFEKEVRRRFPGISFDADIFGEKQAFCVPEKALIVFCHPGIVEMFEFQRDGKQIEIPDYVYPEISSPYLVYLCRGDVDRAREILKSQSHF